MNSARWLPVCAAPLEGEGLADLGVAVLGIGKAAAAGRLSRILTTQRPLGVLLFGVCGAYPDRHRQGRGPAPVRPGELCVVGEERFGDEGVRVSRAVLDLAAVGQEIGPFAADPVRSRKAALLLHAPVVRGCTVSMCSGTDESSAETCERTGADVETMEGAAVALVCRDFTVPLLQVRCVSNWTGDRERGAWDLEAAVQKVRTAVRRLVALLDEM
jgi:futalosine hydrolase